MNDSELIARQAKQIAVQEDLINSMLESCKNVRLKIVCIGGPLNDNKLKYTNDQLKIFQYILDELYYV